MEVDQSVVRAIAPALRARADPTRAAGQQAYMKSTMPYYGVPMAGVDQVVRELGRGWAPSRPVWEATVSHVWDHATHREVRYVALGLARHRAARVWQDPDLLPLYQHWITTGAWWDYVDVIAAHLVGEVLRQHRATATALLRGWATDDDLWVRRTAVLCQLRHKADTDTALLAYCVEQNLDDRSFWLRKAIGWALREFARTDPAWVRAHVAQWDGRISGLSRREALKHIG